MDLEQADRINSFNWRFHIEAGKLLNGNRSQLCNEWKVLSTEGWCLLATWWCFTNIRRSSEKNIYTPSKFTDECRAQNGRMEKLTNFTRSFPFFFLPSFTPSSWPPFYTTYYTHTHIHTHSIAHLASGNRDCGWWSKENEKQSATILWLFRFVCSLSLALLLSFQNRILTTPPLSTSLPLHVLPITYIHFLFILSKSLLKSRFHRRFISFSISLIRYCIWVRNISKVFEPELKLNGVSETWSCLNASVNYLFRKYGTVSSLPR